VEIESIDVDLLEEEEHGLSVLKEHYDNGSQIFEELD
jgi:hypothetical protein